MTKAILDWELAIAERNKREGREQGRVEGRAEGREQGEIINQHHLVTNMHKNGMTVEQIADVTELTVKEVEAALEEPVFEGLQEA
ncbi:hypothetical protein CL176_04265 [Suicoccus acidiformans]|uniref:Uncharacterized protein n=1 Tax=Suicoccus acidiformans TaxID=2036206 RepID=A0A347WJL5_9LACT|nr:hypothetical protein [Suicoccus acidiformans]AXY25272.1 hypothetical protein CL176_04265 [Suicoccus acidiformans]